MILLQRAGTAILFLQLLTSNSFAQTPATTPSEKPAQENSPDQGLIEGRVIDSVTNAPLPGAEVTYRQNGKPGPRTVSGQDGRFRFRNVPPGVHSFVALAKDHQTRDFDGNILLLFGQTLSDLTLRLIPFSSLSGRIIDDDGKAIKGAEVELWHITYLSGMRSLRKANKWTHTDQEGAYRFPLVEPGRYYLSAAAGSIRRFFPSTVDPEAAASIDLLPGVGLPNVDLSLSKTNGATVRGEVRSSRPADITLIPETFLMNAILSTNTSPPTGTFEIRDVLPGLYTLRARVKDGDHEEWAWRSITVSADGVDGIELTPMPAPSLTGYIRVEGGPGESDLSKFVIQLYPTDRASGDIMFAEKADGEGAIRFVELVPGRFRVSMSNLPPGFYLKQVRVGPQEIVNRVLDFSIGSIQKLEAIVSRNAATVTGVAYVNDATKPFPEATVVLIPREKRGVDDKLAYLWRRTDGAGHFAFSSVPPGEYLAFAWEKVDLTDNVFMDSSFMATVRTKGVVLSVTEGTNAKIEVPVDLEQ